MASSERGAGLKGLGRPPTDVRNVPCYVEPMHLAKHESRDIGSGLLKGAQSAPKASFFRHCAGDGNGARSCSYGQVVLLAISRAKFR